MLSFLISILFPSTEESFFNLIWSWVFVTYQAAICYGLYKLITYLVWRLQSAEFQLPVDKMQAKRPPIDGKVLTISEAEEITRITADKTEITIYCPGSMQVLGTAPVMTPEQVIESVKRAREAQKTWKQTTFSERRRVLRTLSEYMLQHQQDFVEISNLETGKTLLESQFGEVMTTVAKIAEMVGSGEDLLSTEFRSPGLVMSHKYATVSYLPLGVIGLIIPWNYPLHNALSHIITAIFAGNAVVVKVSEWASWSVKFLDDLCQSLLQATGHPKDLIQFVTGFATTGSTLVQNVDKVLFIGSPGIGKRVMEAAANVKNNMQPVPVTLELGGKDPFIVCEDADLSLVMFFALKGAFLNNGQNCISAERFYVYEGIYDRFLDTLKQKLEKVRLGQDCENSRCDIGAINLPSQMVKYNHLIDDAVKKGAKIFWGGKKDESLKGHFFTPTVLINCDHSMEVMKEEAFGPIMTIMKVKSDSEAIKLANDCIYGLGSSIFSGDKERAKKIAQALETGMTCINEFGVSATIYSLPFGGIKMSGFGKFGGAEGLRDFTYQKTCVYDKFPFTFAPPAVLDLPTSPQAHKRVQDVLKMIFAFSAKEKLAGLTNFLTCLSKKEY